MKRRFAALPLLGALVLGLSACGGGGGSSSEPPETVRTTADTATALRGSAVIIDVLANDSASRGGVLSLSAIRTAPGAGQAVIENNRVRYTPNPNHLGTDRLSYVARLANGTEAVGELTINTEARMLLRGTVTDGPIANAAVALSVGGRSYTATADAQGRYQIEAVLQQPGEMLRLEASGVAAQAQVRLSSLVGDAASLLASAPASSNEVAEAARGALRVTHVSTAQEALVQQAGNGTAPATQAALEAAQAGLDPLQLINLAATIKLVVDGGLALPAGTPDTLALARNPAAVEAFATANAAVLSQMAAQVAADPTLGLPAFSPVPAGATSATNFYFFGRGAVGQMAYRVLYRADGTAEVTGANSRGSQAARWSLDAGELNVRFDTPWSRQSIGLAINPATGGQEQTVFDVRLHALHFRVISGTRDSAVVHLDSTTSFLRNGVLDQPETRGGVPRIYQQRVLAALDTPLRAEDFAPGTRWGGLGFFPSGVPATDPFYYAGMADLLEFQAGGVARQQITGQLSNWQVADGVLELRRADGERLLYRRLQRVAGQEERWLVERQPAGGAPVELTERLVVRQDPALAFTPGTVAGLWLSQINLLTTEGNSRFFVRLQSDGAAAQVSSNFSASTGTWTISDSAGRNWGLLPDGSLRVQRPSPLGSPPFQDLRDWIPLARQGDKLMVLEWRALFEGSDVNRARPESASGWRTNIYTLVPNAY